LQPPGGGSSFSLFGAMPEEKKTSKIVQPETVNTTDPVVDISSDINDGASKIEESSKQSNISDTPGVYNR